MEMMTMTIEWTIDVRLVAAVLFGLVCFGLYYNRFVECLEDQGKDRGFMSFLVTLGCSVTILAFALMTSAWGAAALVTLCFAASGTPMIIGSVSRYAQARKREEVAIRTDAQQVLRDDG